MIKNAILSLVAMCGVGAIPVQDGKPLVMTLADAMSLQLDDHETRISALEAKHEASVKSAAVADTSQYALEGVVSERVTHINGNPVDRPTTYFQPQSQPAVQYQPQPAVQYQPQRAAQPVRRVVNRPRFFAPRSQVCGPNGCY